jgi:hypothetical protein
MWPPGQTSEPSQFKRSSDNDLIWSECITVMLSLCGLVFSEWMMYTSKMIRMKI